MIFASMTHGVSSYKRLLKKISLPQLIIIDGGKDSVGGA
jgi:excinuclease UvrABC nuclease subunit